MCVMVSKQRTLLGGGGGGGGVCVCVCVCVCGVDDFYCNRLR